MFITRRIVKPLLFSHNQIPKSHLFTTVKTTFSRLSVAMSTEPTTTPPSETPELSKKAAKKEAAKLEKLRKKQEAAAASAATAVSELSVSDPLSGNYGDFGLQWEKVTDRKFTDVKALTEELKDEEVTIRGRVHNVRAVSKKLGFVVIRNGGIVQCVLAVKPDLVSEQMVRFSNSLSSESVVYVVGVVTVPQKPLESPTLTQKVEIQVRKIYCVSRAVPLLPFNIEDASRSDAEIDEALKEGKQLAKVNQDTRLNNRVLDLRTPANQAIFGLQSEINFKFQDILRSMGFRGIHSPKLMGGTSEGGAAVFRLDYKGQPACLAQSPQLHKQMSISGDFMKVYEIGPVFRAEDSFTHRHLCEFTGLDAELVIDHYSEVMDVVDKLFVELFDHLNKNMKEELEVISKQYPFTPLKYLRKTLQLTFEEGVQLLKEAGIEVDPFGDLNTETERKLGKLVCEKYDTEFYILHRYPLAVRPFYTMPCYDNKNYSNSFDVFIRGEEIISGAQRIHDPVLLKERATQAGIDAAAISSYLESFQNGAWPHGGFGVGLERVVMLFCNLNNIRKTSLFPRDPQRLAP